MESSPNNSQQDSNPVNFQGSNPEEGSNKRRLTTPQHIIDAIKENCIYQGAGKRRQLDVMYTHLESTNLLSLLLGYRC